MFEKNMENIVQKSTYKSCIKINGVPILPPLITPERKKELLKYKKQAVKLEQRLKNCRELKRNLDELLSLQPLTGRSTDVSFQGNSHAEALGILEPFKGAKIEKPRKLSLSRDIVDVSQYSNDGIKVLYAEEEINKLNSSSETANDVESIETSFAETMKILDSKSQQCPILDITTVEGKPLEKACDTQSTPKPRLIRSNSYTLEAPSPVLLANMNKVGPDTENSHYSFIRNWSSLENNYVPFESSDFSSINTVLCNENKSNSSVSTPKKECRPTGEVKSPTIEVFQTDISVQQVMVNTFDKTEENSAVLSHKQTDLNDPNSHLMRVLKKIPEEYSNQVIEIIKHQRSEQEQRLQRYDKIVENSANTQKKIENVKNPDTGQPAVEKLRRSSTFSMSPSQSIYYSVNNSNTDTRTPTPSASVKLVDLDSDFERSERSNCTNRKLNWEDQINDDIRNHNVDHDLLAKVNASTLTKLRREWAASVIGAHVKGYLTRRLLKTERVQALIDTIKDALMCALELHTSEIIEEADVELHRRLLQQVSAACFAFHDIFFALPVREQMQIIAIDRQHKSEKAKRPISASSSRRALSSSRSASSRTSFRSFANI